MKKVILSTLTALCSIMLFYISYFQQSYLDNRALMYTLHLSTLILILLHFKVYKKK